MTEQLEAAAQGFFCWLKSEHVHLHSEVQAGILVLQVLLRMIT